MALRGSLEQAWPAFVLVAGLLLVGLAAHSDGLFDRAGALLERVPGPPIVLLLAGMLLVALVTAILNLDTAVVFLTPVLVLAARRRGAREEPFLVSAVFMANASSLYLPGSNLTNLLVLDRHHISGGAFASEMIAPALAATLVTAAGLLLIFHQQLRAGVATKRASATTAHPPVVGAFATLAAAVLTVVLHTPALAVLAVGGVAVTIQLTRRALTLRDVVRAVGPAALAALFVLSVSVGVLARSWDGPARALAHAGLWGTAAIGALASVAINNLPSAVLLSARPLGHARALLLGLNLGPNLAVTGALSAYLWLKAARQLGAQPSLLAFSRRGLLLAPAALAAALFTLTLGA